MRFQRGAFASARRAFGGTSAGATPRLVYVGGYTRKMYYGDSEDAFHPGGGQGIYAFEHDGHGALRQLHEPFDAGCNPTFLATNPAGDVLLACNEGGPEDADANTLTSFAIDRHTGALSRTGSQPTGGAGPCFVSVTPCGGFALVAHYHTGNVSVLPLSDGSLGAVVAHAPAADAETEAGAVTGLWSTSAATSELQSQVRADQPPAPAHVRAECAHAHSVYALPVAPTGVGGCPVVVLDLGLDLVLSTSLRLHRGGGGLSEARAAVRMPPTVEAGGIAEVHGPRHLALHRGPGAAPFPRFAFVANELSASVSACALDSDTDTGCVNLRPLCSRSALPLGFVRPPPHVWATSPVPERCAAALGGISHCAHVEVSPDGRHVLVSNRGHDSIAVFHFDAERAARAAAAVVSPHPDDAQGVLELVGHCSSGGHIPRHFSIDPWSSGIVLVGNHYDDNITALRLGEDGSLVPTGEVTSVPTPTCVLML